MPTKNINNIILQNNTKQRVEKQTAVIRFAGDSGDGIQAIGRQMVDVCIKHGNYVHTLPDFPAEIRSPIGTVFGVSSFQLCFSEHEIFTAGDTIDTLMVFNPAALKHSLPDLNLGGILIADINKFTDTDLKKAGYLNDPIANGELNNYRLITIPITVLTQTTVAPYNLTRAQALKCKNMFALGIIYYLYALPLEYTLAWIQNKFKDQKIIAANQAACNAGYEYAANTSIFPEQFVIEGTKKYFASRFRHITGNQAIAFGCLAIAANAPNGVFVGGYPITPATEILQELTKYPDLNVITFQAEDEISAVSACIGAAFGGSVAITCTSGPGFDLKQEAIGLAVMAELPLVVVNVQRVGPSTGIATKSEQTDLLAAMYGRHGESPVAILAPSSPGDCFWIMLEAAQIAVRHMIPVIVLSDGTLANVAESWQIPDVHNIPKLEISYCKEAINFQPYKRNSDTLAREWAIPGTPNLTHRIGGLEKKNISGEVNYTPENHDQMVRIRALKIDAIAKNLPATTILGDVEAKLVVISWGSTFGVTKSVINLLCADGFKVAHVHLRYLNPLPNDLGLLIKKFDRVVCIEANLGQLTQILRAKYLIDIKLISNVTGKQFMVNELKKAILNYLK